MDGNEETEINYFKPKTWTISFPACPTGVGEKLKITDPSKIDIELFAHIEFLSEIKDKGLTRINEINEDNATEENWLSFQAFVRQAKLYYFSAKEQSPAVSSLNFFYAFLNLVKAYCCLHNSTAFSGYMKHGISLSNGFNDAFSQEISFHEHGVFSYFYRLVTGMELAPVKIPATKFLSYCSDISYEYWNCVKDPEMSSSYMKMSLAGEVPAKMSTLISISNSKILDHPLLIKMLSEKFEQVKLTTQIASDIFDISLDEYRSYLFFKGKDEFPIVPLDILSRECHEKLFPLVVFYPTNPCGLSKINLPFKSSEDDEIFLNEFLAIYCFMFYVSELVRYNPKVIQSNLSTPQGWLMERFIVNTPQTFLRYMVNLITGRDLLFHY